MAENNAATGAEQMDLVITRVFDASIEQVWNAWTDPGLVMQWWGPASFTCPSAAMDVREGGTSLVCMRAPKELGGQDFYSLWEYRKIVPMQQLEFIHNLADSDGSRIDPATIGMPPDFPQDQLQAVRLVPLDGGRTELTITEYDWTVGQMMEMSRKGMEQCLDKMAVALNGRNN